MLIRLLAAGLFSVAAFGQVDAAIRTGETAIDVPALREARVGDVVMLPLFDDRRLEFELLERTSRGASRLMLTGAIPGDPHSVVAIAIHDDTIAGYITANAETYQIRGLPGDRHLVELLDPAHVPACMPVSAPPAVYPDGAPSRIHVAGGVVRIDVLVAYTPAARAKVGGLSGMISTIDLCEKLTNKALEESLTETKINVVHKVELDYVEGPSVTTDLSRLRDLDDGFMDEVHAMRDEHGADQVSLIVDSELGGGAAYVMAFVGPHFESSAFAVSDIDEATGSLTFVHEFGHNLGCCHHAADPGCDGGGAFDYSNGHRFIGDDEIEYRTVMSYAPGERINRFSSPDVLHAGVPTGVAPGLPGEAHNALTIFETRNVVAAFREDQTCFADFNLDGHLNILDFVVFQLSFQEGDITADCDASGSLNVLDFVCFQQAFQAGCE